MDGGVSDTNTQPKNRVSSWFKRASKEDSSSSSFVTMTDTSVLPKDAVVDSDVNHPIRPISQSTDVSSIHHAQKKKSFSFPFWKGTKNELKMSLAGKQGR
jgi:hypothetical protein